MNSSFLHSVPLICSANISAFQILFCFSWMFLLLWIIQNKMSFRKKKGKNTLKPRPLKKKVITDRLFLDSICFAGICVNMFCLHIFTFFVSTPASRQIPCISKILWSSFYLIVLLPSLSHVLGSYPARQHTTRPTPLSLFKCWFVGVSLCWGLPTATHEKNKTWSGPFHFYTSDSFDLNPTCALELLGSQSWQWGQVTALSKDLPGRMRTKGEL